MSNYIYFIINPLLKNYVKIGSTKDYEKRYWNYQFSNPEPWDYKYVFIIKSEYNCYQIDDDIKVEFNEFRCKNERGGTEWYDIKSIEIIKKYVLQFGKLIDVDVSKFKRYTEIEITQNVLEDFKEKKKESNNKIILRDYQTTCLNIFNENLKKDYFQGIYYLATGLGKSIIALFICLSFLDKYPKKNILWITFRNDIIESQKKLFKNYSDKFIFCNNGNFNKEMLNQKKEKYF